MADPGAPDHPVPAALAAFLRGVERRAALFAELLCGDPEQGDLAVAQSMRGFHAQALELPMADWPCRFWQRLTRTPALLPAAGARWAEPLAHLASLEFGDRRALLSRLAAGLPEDEAAEVLDLDLPRYHAALAAACPRDMAGQPDAAGWRALAEAIQSHARYLSPERMARLVRLRGYALAPPAPVSMSPSLSPSDTTRRPASPPARERVRVNWRRWALLTVVIACVLALFATGWWQASQRDLTKTGTLQGTALGVAEDPGIQTEALADTGEPATRITPEEMHATHPDLELLKDPEALAIAQEASLLAWYLAGAPPPVPAEHDDTGERETVSEEEGRDATF